MGKHAFSLKTIYLAALTAVFAVSVFRVRRVRFYYSRKRRQTEQAMLEARTFARMGRGAAVHGHSKASSTIRPAAATSSRACTCSVVGQGVGCCSRRATTPSVRTNFDPRSEQDIPDEFETKALEAFNADRSVTEITGVAVRRRGSVPLPKRSKWTTAASNATASRSASFLDITDHAKEGWTLRSRSAGQFTS